MIIFFIVSAVADSLPLYDMSSMSPTITRLNLTAKSVRLTWPQAIRDIQSTYIVEARAPKKSYTWETRAVGLLATSAVIKGLDIDVYDYEFRIRTSNFSGLGEPTLPASTSGLREKGDDFKSTATKCAKLNYPTTSVTISNWHTSNLANSCFSLGTANWHSSNYSGHHRAHSSHTSGHYRAHSSHTRPYTRCSSVPKFSTLPSTNISEYNSTFSCSGSKRRTYSKSLSNTYPSRVDNS